jgi:hypothetical protein
MIEIRDILPNDTVAMSLTQNEDMTHALAPHTPNEPLADRIGLWWFHRCLEDLNLTFLGYLGETPSILLIIVSDHQKAGPSAQGAASLVC